MTSKPQHLQESGSASYEAAVVPPHEFALMLAVCAELGADPRRVCAGTGLKPAMLYEPATRLSYRQIEKLVRNALTLTATPHLGLLVAARMTVSAYGMLGYAMMSCATVGQALEIGLRYYKTSSMMMEIAAEDGGDTVAIVASPGFRAPDLLPFMVEELFGGIMPVARTLAGEVLRPVRVQLSYLPPAYAARYDTVFDCPVEFNCTANRLVIDRALLDKPLPNADPISVRQCTDICEQLLPRGSEPDIVHAIRQVILGQPGLWPDMESVSKSLNMSERTLRRRITERDRSFQQIVDELRCEVATQYLRESDLSVQDIAGLTGFSETANFRRAFKRWTGFSPSKFRTPGGPSMAGDAQSGGEEQHVFRHDRPVSAGTGRAGR